MPIKLMLAANLRKYVHGYDGSTGHNMEVEPGSTVRDIVRCIAMPEEEVKLIMVDGIGPEWDTLLTGNERVAFFPAVGGG